MLQVNVAQLHEDNREALCARLGRRARRRQHRGAPRGGTPAAALIGHLNLTHPNSIQVIGAVRGRGGEPPRRGAPQRARCAADRRRAGDASVADGVAPPPELLAEAATRARTPLFTTPRRAARVIETLCALPRQGARRDHRAARRVHGRARPRRADHRRLRRRQERARPRAHQPRPRPGRRRRGARSARIAADDARGPLPADAEGLPRGARPGPAQHPHHLRRDRGAPEDEAAAHRAPASGRSRRRARPRRAPAARRARPRRSSASRCAR